MPKGSDLLVAALENEGVDRIFGVPGEENLDVVESLRNSKIELILTRHEQAAAFMAATHGRLTGKPGVCISTLGPGALNLSTGAAYAHLGAMPMIMLTGQKAIMTAKQARFQIVDVIASMRPLTKMARQIITPASIPAIVRDAFRVAMEERPGPVHLELPEDVAGEQIDDVPLVPPHPIELPVAPPAALDRAAEMICKAQRPLVMLGAGSSRPKLVEPLSSFIRRTRIPFFNTQMGKGSVTGGSNLYMGTAALSSGDYVHRAVDHADLIISIGHDTVEKPPFIMGPDGPKVIHVGFTAASVEQVYFPHAEVVERKVMPEDGIVCLDNGMYKIWFARNYRTHVANTLLLDNALATMGAGLPSAMMASMLHPKRRILAVCGDGGFMMNSQEMETAVRLGLNLVVLILEDSAYGMIRWKQAVDGFPDWGLCFGNPDFVKYAESYGAIGHRVKHTDDLVPTMEGAFKDTGVHLITVPIDYVENTRVLVEELRGRVPEIA
jgi:acetolactate synthase I/II/III large subunit